MYNHQSIIYHTWVIMQHTFRTVVDLRTWTRPPHSQIRDGRQGAPLRPHAAGARISLHRKSVYNAIIDQESPIVEKQTDI